MEYKIKEETVNEVLAYLGKRPYVEVFKIIPKLQNLEETKGKK